MHIFSHQHTKSLCYLQEFIVALATLRLVEAEGRLKLLRLY